MPLIYNETTGEFEYSTNTDIWQNTENSFSCHFQYCKRNNLRVMSIVFPYMHNEDVTMKHVGELLLSAGLMNPDGKIITVRPSMNGPKWSKPKRIDGKFADIKEVIYLLYLAKELVAEGIKFSANTPYRLLLNAEKLVGIDLKTDYYHL